MSTTDRTTERPISLRRRRDLAIVRQRFGTDRYWVVKDPLTLRFVRLREEEFVLFEALDGDSSMRDLQALFETRFAPRRIQLEEVSRFIGMLHQSGLLVANKPGQGKLLLERGLQRRRRELVSQLLNPLAIRFPGIDPTPFFKVAYSLLRPLFSRYVFALSLTFIAAAALLAAMKWRTMAARLPTFQEFFTPDNLIVLAVVTGLIKVLHEFGHGLACRHYGGETHNLGLMFLIFSPCLYCDVTDAWRLPNKLHRAAVGAAGIFVELNLAAAAMFLWWFSEPGLLPQICLGVMTVSSIGTLLFNANPLLRYDGYYVLADLVETPNLAERASSSLRWYFSRFCLGIDAEPDPLVPPQRRAIYAVFAAASAAYRWLITLSIILFLVAAARPYRLEFAARLLGLLGIGALILEPIIRAYAAMVRYGLWRRVQRARAAITGFALLLILVVLAFCPLPHRVFGPLELRPFDAATVYVAVPGRIVDARAKYGERVSAEEILVRMESPEVELAIEELTGRRDLQSAELIALRREQFDNPAASASIPRAEKLLASLEGQLSDKLHDRARLTLTAPRDGVFFPPEWTPAADDAESLPTWSGRPLDRLNLGATLDVGLAIGQIIDPLQWQALVVVDQQDVQFLRVGDPVTILLDALPDARFESRIEEIAVGELRRAPRRLSQRSGGEVVTTSDGERPVSTSYQVLVRLDDPTGRFRLGWRGTARIQAAALPLAVRWYRSFSRMFHFEL